MMGRNQDIQCNVDNCKFYSSGYCTAERIQVDNQYGSMSNNSDDTICVTFQPKTG